MSDQSQKTPAASPKKWRWGRIALIVSLALNLLFVGAIGGSMWAMWAGYWGGPRHHAFAGAIHHLMKTLPEERRQIARDVLRRHRAEIRPLRRQVRTSRRAAARVMRQEPFDEASFRSALGAMQKAELDIRQAVGEIAVDLGKTLTQDERRELLRGLARHGRFGRRHGFGRGKKNGTGKKNLDEETRSEAAGDNPMDGSLAGPEGGQTP